MKLLLVLGSDDNSDAVFAKTKAQGFELIRYRHVLKAMDNIDEIDPSAVIISARDFPMHWKLLVQFIRSERSMEKCPIIILKGERFNAEETSKAYFLRVNGIMADSLENDEEVDRFRKILGLPCDDGSAAEEVKNRSFAVEPWHNVGLLIADLFGSSVIAGDVSDVSSESLTFTPVQALSLDETALHKELHECSLRVGDAIFSPVCRICSIGEKISLDFVSFPENEQQLMNRHLQSLM